jgi:hypothetical protein
MMEEVAMLTLKETAGRGLQQCFQLQNGQWQICVTAGENYFKGSLQ